MRDLSGFYGSVGDNSLYMESIGNAVGITSGTTTKIEFKN